MTGYLTGNRFSFLKVGVAASIDWYHILREVVLLNKQLKSVVLNIFLCI